MLNMALIPLVPMLVTMIFNWSVSMCFIMKVSKANTCLGKEKEGGCMCVRKTRSEKDDTNIHNAIDP